MLSILVKLYDIKGIIFSDKNQQFFNLIHIVCVKFSEDYTGFVKAIGILNLFRNISFSAQHISFMHVKATNEQMFNSLSL